MELVFNMLNTTPGVGNKTFTQIGGVIGRGEKCDWVISSTDVLVSRRHASVSYKNNEYFLTDLSANGTFNTTKGERLPFEQAVRIENGSTYRLGNIEVLARLVGIPATFGIPASHPPVAASLNPDNWTRELDPLIACGKAQAVYSGFETAAAPDITLETTRQYADYARIDRESLVVPTLIEASVEPDPAPETTKNECQSDSFWEQFGIALEVDLSGLDHDAKETLALSAARLLKQSIGGLQQSLLTRNELKNELRLAQSTVQTGLKNPLKLAIDTGEALNILLLEKKSGQLPPEQTIPSAFRDLQAHQVALLAASRAAVRGALEHFSPQQLTLRFERDNAPFFPTSGNRWRAFARYHQTLCQDDEWSARLLARDFAQTYEEQIRLIYTLHPDYQG